MVRILAAIALVIAGCGPSVTVPTTETPRVYPSPYYVVVNVDGPPVDVVVNDVTVTHLRCGMSGFDLLAEPGVPPLPWTIRLVKPDGSVLYEGTVDEVSNYKAILMRGEVAGEMDMPSSAGPPPQSPCPE